jgi:hypothetical protein
MNEIDLVKAIRKLKPTAQFSFNDLDYATIKWDVLEGEAPSQDEIDAALIEIKAEEAQAKLDKDRKSDGWIADSRHLAKGTSDHIPRDGFVRAIDIDSDLSAHKEEAYALVEKIRKLAKEG